MTQNRISEDIFWMRRALRLAGRGYGATSPNPMVGACIVRDGVLLGEGYHKHAGEPHAEINAFRSLENPASALGATLYVTLEPCSTFGRTPPCCDAILENGIARVVVGCTDPNPKHAGRGLELLRSRGVEVVSGVLEKECRARNEVFFHWILTGRPFVLLKLAETLDGKIATESGSSQWITGPEARKHVMRLRLGADAILAGAETYRTDHPSFTARTADGRILKSPRKFVATHHPERDDLPGDCEKVSLDTPAAWTDFLLKLGSEQITMLLIEGGGELAASALRAGVVNRVEFHIAPKILGGRGSRPSVGGDNPLSIDESVAVRDLSIRKAGCDFIASGIPEKRSE